MRKIQIALLVLMSISAWCQSKQQGVDKDIVFMCQPCSLPCDTTIYDKPGICPSCKMPLYATYRWLKHPDHVEESTLNKTVAILLFPGVELIDFAGPYEFFRAAGAHVITVAETAGIVTSATSLKITPDYRFDNMPHADIIVLPGGNVNRNNPKILEWLKKQSENSEKVLSVCNGAFFLAGAGLLDGLQATTFYPQIARLREISPRTKVVNDQRYVSNGKIVTSAGLSSGIDAALFVVSEYLGIGAAQQLAVLLEYKWNYNNGFVRAQLADTHFARTTDVFAPLNGKIVWYEGNNNMWELRVRVQHSITSAQLMKILAAQFEQVQKWNLRKSDEKTGSWSYKVDGRAWVATAEIDRKSDQELLVTIKVKLEK